MKCDEIIRTLEELFPLKYAYEWDNSGLQVGGYDKEITKICIGLDGTDQVIEEAIKQKADLLILHHPLMMKGMKQVISDDFIGRRIMKLIQHNITCYAIHTNFDVIEMGQMAADKLMLQEVQVLSPCSDSDTMQGCGRVGKLPKSMTVRECAKYIKEKFQLETVRIYGEPKEQILTVAIMPGSGGDMISDALRTKVDLMITGDIKHHEGLDANARGLVIMDAGHFELEKLFVPCIENYLKVEFPQIEIQKSNQKAPFWVI